MALCDCGIRLVQGDAPDVWDSFCVCFSKRARPVAHLSFEFLDLGAQLLILCPQLLILGNRAPNQFEQSLCAQLCEFDFWRAVF
jgi:hypothetical protein